MFENNSIEPVEPRRVRAAKDTHTDDVAKAHNFYTSDKPSLMGKSQRTYYADYQQKSEVMRAQENRITTKLDDRQTVSAMLDLAESRGWDRIKLSGSDSFKREAWVQAEVRGVETSGYKPKETDRQEAKRRQVAAQPVAKPAEKPAPAPSAQKKEQPKQQRQQEKAAEKQPVTKPAEAPTNQQREQEKGVWNVVETQGKAAREQDSGASKAAEKPAEKPAAVAA